MWKLAIAAAALSGLLLWAASEPAELGWLSWIAIAPAAAVAVSGRGRAGRAAIPVAYAIYLELLLVPSLPFGLAEGQWGDPPVPVLIGDSPVVIVALVAIPLFGLLLYGLGFGRPPRALGRLGAFVGVLAPAIAWTALDFGRTKLDPGGLWGPLFANQVGEPATELMTLGGPWALTFAIVAVNYGLAISLIQRRFAPVTIVVAATAALTGLAAATAPGERAPDRLTVAAVQPGYDTADDVPETRHFRTGSYALAALDTIDDLGELTEDAAERGAQLVVWPEAAIWVDPSEEPEVRIALEQLAGGSGATIVVGGFDPIAQRSEAFLVEPTAAGGAGVSEGRPKQRPMWFLGERARPAEPEPLDGAGVAIGTMLGVDTQDPSVARALADRGGELLTSSTHDWRELAPHHAAQARAGARAVALPLVRADWRYGSAIHDRDGSPLAEAGNDAQREVLVAEITPATTPSTYTRLGDLVGWACTVFALGWLAFTLIPRAHPFLKRV